MPNPDYKYQGKEDTENNNSFSNWITFLIILVNITFLLLAIFSESFRNSLPDNDNSPSCRYEQNCDGQSLQIYNGFE